MKPKHLVNDPCDEYDLNVMLDDLELIHRRVTKHMDGIRQRGTTLQRINNIIKYVRMQKHNLPSYPKKAKINLDAIVAFERQCAECGRGLTNNGMCVIESHQGVAEIPITRRERIEREERMDLIRDDQEAHLRMQEERLRYGE